MTRFESSVTSLSWIPLEAVEGIQKLSFRMGLGHYDPPPPDRLVSIGSLLAKDRIRFANVLKAWIEVEGGDRAAVRLVVVPADRRLRLRRGQLGPCR